MYLQLRSCVLMFLSPLVLWWFFYVVLKLLPEISLTLHTLLFIKSY